MALVPRIMGIEISVGVQDYDLFTKKWHLFRGLWVLKSPWECKIMICLLRNGTYFADYGY